MSQKSLSRMSINEVKLRVRLLRLKASKESQSTSDEYKRDRRLGMIMAYSNVLRLLKGHDE